MIYCATKSSSECDVMWCE